MGDVVIDELLVFSDHHAHPFTFGAKEELVGNTLYNSRLVASRNVLLEMADYAASHNIKRIVFGGDLYHTREAVPTEAVNLTMEAISKFKGKLHMLVGNHDCSDRDGNVHSLYPYRWFPNVTVHDWAGHLVQQITGQKGDAYTLCFVPHTEDKELATRTIANHASLPAGPKLLFAHLGMQGAKVGSDYVLVSNGDISLADIPYNDFTGCLFGHYHEHQQLFKNGWYVGATHQHNWGDVNTVRGFLHVKVFIDHIEFTQVETKSAPRFIAVADTSLDARQIRPQDYVKVLTEKKMSDREIAKLRSQINNVNSEVVYVPPEVKLSSVDLSGHNLSPSAMVETWVTANKAWLDSNLPNVETEELVNYGKQLLTLTKE